MLRKDTAAPVLMDCVMETDGQSALAQQLLQTGPADAQGQEDVESDVEDDPATVRAAESAGLPDSGRGDTRSTACSVALNARSAYSSVP